MAHGTVKWFDSKKGFGFITPDGGNANDVFVHHTGINMAGYRELQDGQAVEFQTEQGQKGLQAVNVTVLE